jgi:hypothetical protein
MIAIYDKITELKYLIKDMSLIKRYFFERKLDMINNSINYSMLNTFPVHESVYHEYKKYLEVLRIDPNGDIICSFKDNLIDLLNQDLKQIKQEVQLYVTTRN